jgi:hypothetical protein
MKRVLMFTIAFGSFGAIGLTGACGGKVLETEDGGAPSPYPTGGGRRDGGPGFRPDAGTPLPSPPPSGVPDASVTPVPPGCGGDGTCCPADMSSFVPKWHPPAARTQKCTQAQVDGYHQCLRDGQTQSNPASCAPFGSNVTAANKACVACIVTQDTAPQYGPIIVSKGTVQMNVAGCIAIATNDPNGNGCAGAYSAASECSNSACAPSCPVTDTASFEAEQQCEAAANQGTCSAFAAKAKCADSLAQAGGVVAQCLNAQSFDALYDAIVPMFCE